MDLLEQTHMQDVYQDITYIIDKIANLTVYPPLCWVWTWDVTKSILEDFEGDPEYVVNFNEEQVFQKFYQDADKNGFTLEYGTEDLYEAIRDWMIDTDIITEVSDVEEDK